MTLPTYTRASSAHDARDLAVLTKLAYLTTRAEHLRGTTPEYRTFAAEWDYSAAHHCAIAWAGEVVIYDPLEISDEVCPECGGNWHIGECSCEPPPAGEPATEPPVTGEYEMEW